MQKKCIAILISVFMLTMAGCGNKETADNEEKTNEEVAIETIENDAEETVAETDEQVTASSDEEPIVFSAADLTWVLPKGFKALDGEEGVYVHKNYPKDTATVTYVISESNTDYSDISKEEFQDLLEDDFYDVYGDKVTIDVSKYEKFEVTGRTALRIEFTYLFKGTDYLQTEIMIFNGDETHIINYTQEKDGKWEEEFEKSIETFAFAE